MENKRYIHNFMEERKWLIYIQGFAQTRSVPYLIYLGVIFMFYMFVVFLSAFGAYTATNKELVVEAMHAMVIILFGIWVYVSRFVTQRSLYETIDTIKSGFFKYEGEELETQQVKITEGVVEEARKATTMFSILFFLGGLSNCVGFPLSQWFLVTEEQYEQYIKTFNPYLSLYVYLPFSSRSTIGFISAYIINVLIVVYTFGMAMVSSDVYMSTIIQLKAQLQILNHSIRNIYKRAYKAYLKNYDPKTWTPREPESIYKDIEFQKCLYNCLRENIRHHQLLLRYINLYFSN